MPESRILIVDDEKGLLNLYSRWLAAQDYSVDAAVSGQQALALFEKNPYDLVFLDLMMPQMDGVQILKEIRKMDADVPIYIITAFENRYVSRLQSCRDAGLDFEVLRKPIDRKEFVEIAVGILSGLFASGDADVEIQLKFFVILKSKKSDSSVRNLRSCLDQQLAGRYSLEIIDVMEKPEEAYENDVIATPTLIRKVPLPEIKIIGDLSDQKTAEQAVNMLVGNNT